MNEAGVPPAQADAPWAGDERDFLLWLSDTLRDEFDPQIILRRMTEALGRRLNADTIGCAEVDSAVEYATITCEWLSGRIKGRLGVRNRISDYAPPELVAGLLAGEVDVINDVRTDPRLEGPRREAMLREGVQSHLTIPLLAGGQIRFVIVASCARPRTWSSAEIALAQEVAVRTWATLERVRASAALLAAEQNQRFLVGLGDRLRTLGDPQEVLLAAAETLGRHLGVNRAGYAEVELDGTLVIGRDWTDGTVRHGTSRQPIAGFGRAVVESLERGETGRFEDARTDPRVGPAQRPAFEAMEIVAALTVPLVKGGRLVGMLSIHQKAPRSWTEAEVQLVEDVAERTWAALERVRVELALRTAEKTQRFLLELGDRLRPITDPEEVLLAAAEALGLKLETNRVGYAQVLPDETLIFGREWIGPGAQAIASGAPLSAFGEGVAALLRSGRTLRVDDAETSPLIDAAARATFEYIGMRAVVVVPLIHMGRLTAMLGVQNIEPRIWTDDEQRLIEDVAERTWDAFQRAQAEQGLRDSEQQFRQLANNLPALCWMADAEGKPFWFNRRWCEYFGLSSEEETSAAWDSRSSLPPEMLESVEARWAEALTSQEPFDMTLPLRGHDGVLRTFLTRVEPMRDGDGRVVRWFGMNTDVTEQIEAERVRTFLLGLEDRLRPLLDPAEVIYAVAEELGRYLGVNRGGYAEVDDDHFVVERPWSDGEVDDAIGRYPINSFDPAVIESVMRGETFVCDDVEADPRISEAYRGAYSALEMRSIVTKPLFKDGELVAIMTVNQRTPRKWTDAEARLVGEVGERAWASVARARAEARLRQSQALLAAFMENAPVGMYLKDADGRYLLANSGMERLLQRPAEQAIGLTAAEIFPTDMAAVAAQQDMLAFTEGRAQVTYRVPISDDRNEGWSLIIRFPIRGEGGDRIGGFVIDIDEQKRAEAELARSREALYQSEKLTALGSLLAGVSHELNNPLAVVVGQSMMLEEEAQGGPFERRALKIRGAAERCARIVQTFLAMARQKPPARTIVDANQVVQSALDLVDYGLRTAGVAVRKRLDPQLPPLSADADQLHQVVANLLVNAQHALQAVGGPREVSVTTRVGPTGRVEIEVADNGPGVPADIRRRVFEPFFTTKPQGLGTGLGLSFSHGVIEAHGGRLELLDGDRGAAFRISLPAVEGSRVEAGASRLPVTAPGRGAALVIDDEPEIADMLAELLRRQGYQVSTAESGREGRAQLEAGRFDIVLSDLRMPDMDGPALFEWMARDRPDLTSRLGFVTGDTLGPAASTFLARAGRPYLEKPFTPSAVRAFVAKLAAEVPATVEA